MNSCLMWAYHVNNYQISGPPWIHVNTYDIMAKASGVVREEQLRLMLQTLLAERFGLRVHEQKRAHAVTALLLSQKGPGFHESASGSVDASRERTTLPDGRRRTLYRNTPMDAFADSLSFWTFGPVVNLTGLSGRYDITLTLASRTHGSPDEFYTDLLSALRDQLGLRLETREGSINVISVDHLNEVPTGN